MDRQQTQITGAEFHNIGKRYASASLSKLDFPNETCTQVHDWVRNDKCFLVLEGNPGIGKTYFASALVNLWHSQKKWVRYFTANSYLETLRQAVSNDFDATSKIREICECNYLIIDDFASNISHTEWQKEMMFHTIDIRYSSELPTVIITNYTKDLITSLYTERTSSRIYATESTYICLQGKDKRKESS